MYYKSCRHNVNLTDFEYSQVYTYIDIRFSKLKSFILTRDLLWMWMWLPFHRKSHFNFIGLCIPLFLLKNGRETFCLKYHIIMPWFPVFIQSGSGSTVSSCYSCRPCNNKIRYGRFLKHFKKVAVTYPDQCKNCTKLHDTIARSKIIRTKVRRTETYKSFDFRTFSTLACCLTGIENELERNESLISPSIELWSKVNCFSCIPELFSFSSFALLIFKLFVLAINSAFDILELIDSFT